VATGTFSEYTLWKENAPDTEFGETFEWKPEFNAISKEYWVDKAVGAYCVSQFLGETKVACPLSSIAVKKFMRRTAVPHGAQRYSCAGGATNDRGKMQNRRLPPAARHALATGRSAVAAAEFLLCCSSLCLIAEPNSHARKISLHGDRGPASISSSALNNFPTSAAHGWPRRAQKLGVHLVDGRVIPTMQFRPRHDPAPRR
jgi:hypothetical protein